MLFIISSPSGAGKSTLCRFLLQNNLDIDWSISVTTRKMRPGESNGKEYYFVTKDQFISMQGDDEFLETAEFCGNYYGTLKSEVTRILNSGKNAVLFDIEWQGASQIKNNSTLDVVTVYIMPPSFEELEKRLRKRRTESEEDIQRRILSAKEEIHHADEYQYVIVNDNIESAKEKLQSIYNLEKKKRNKN